MFLVELFAGREHLYQSVDELSAAIQRGDIRPDSRIFHRMTSTWVPIIKHPEYRKIMAGMAAEPLPPLARSKWTFYGLEPRGREIDESSGAGGTDQAPSSAAPRSAGWRALLRRAFRFFQPTKVAETAKS